MTPYDRWILRSPPETPEFGTEPGEPCDRWQEPDEDYPIPHKCLGEMIDDDGETVCPNCGATPE